MTERKPHKHAEVIKAWADGKPIQVRHKSIIEWEDYVSSITPDFNNEFFEWRIKPERVDTYHLVEYMGEGDGEAENFRNRFRWRIGLFGKTGKGSGKWRH